MTEIKLYKVKYKGLEIIGMTIPFIVMGILLITQKPYGTTGSIIGWLNVCFFGLGIPLGFFHIFDKRPQIIIDENGVWDRTTKQDQIKWEQIIEAYPANIYGQKFISIVTDETFVFKKKQYKWFSKINSIMGAQRFNLQLSQINIDVNQLTDFINKLSKENTDERKKLIPAININSRSFSVSNLRKILVYVLTSITLLLLSLNYFTAFMTIMVLMGVSALIIFTSSEKMQKSKIRKYIEVTTWLGFVNMVLLLLTINVYDHVTESVGSKISTEIENYKDLNSVFPKDIKSINQDLDLNFIGNYYANKIEYKANVNNYELELNSLFGKQKKFNKQLNEWE